MSSWAEVLMDPAKTVLSQVGQFIVNVLLVVIILIIGWIISKLIKTLVERVLKAVKIDTFADRIELTDVLAKGGVKYALSELVAVICYWVAILVTFVVAINAVGLTVTADLLNRVILYVPNIISAIFILILGIFVATVLSTITKTAANNAGISQSKLLGKIVEIVVVVFAAAVALEQLGIGAKTLQLLISLILGSFCLAIAIAFGLGCRDIAEKFVSDLIEKVKNKK